MRRSTTELLALHGLRLKGFAAASVVADMFALSEPVVVESLELSSQDGFAKFRDGSRSGWSLTSEGRKENERLLAVELDENGLRNTVEQAYQAFLPLNSDLLAVCTRWQVSDIEAQVLNDHQDEAYDASVIAELGEIHVKAVPICADLGGQLERFGGYGSRFAEAMDNIRSGETDWFTKPTLDSYHTVWFELHEDLLATLGLDRAAEHT